MLVFLKCWYSIFSKDSIDDSKQKYGTFPSICYGNWYNIWMVGLTNGRSSKPFFCYKLTYNLMQKHILCLYDIVSIIIIYALVVNNSFYCLQLITLGKMYLISSRTNWKYFGLVQCGGAVQLIPIYQIVHCILLFLTPSTWWISTLNWFFTYIPEKLCIFITQDISTSQKST